MAKQKRNISSNKSHINKSSISKITSKDIVKKEIIWVKDVSLVTNKIVMLEMLKLFGITGLVMALLMTFIFVGTDEIEAVPQMLLMTTLIVGGLYILSLIIMVIFYGNKMPMQFNIDDKGVLMEVTSGKAKFGNRALVALGLISGKIGAVGSGLTSISQEKQYVAYKDIDQVNFDNNAKIISIYNSWRRVGILFCNNDNYDEIKKHFYQVFKSVLKTDHDGNLVQDIAKSSTNNFAGGQRSAVNKKNNIGSELVTDNKPIISSKRSSKIWDFILDTALVVIACIPMFMIQYPQEIDLFIIILLICFAVATIWLIPLLGWVVMFFSVIAIMSAIFQLFQIIPSFFVPSETYIAFELYNFEDWFVLTLFLSGQAYLIYNSVRYISGKKISALLAN